MIFAINIDFYISVSNHKNGDIVFDPTVRTKTGARNLVLVVHSTVLYIATFTDIVVLIICFVRIEHAFVTCCLL